MAKKSMRSTYRRRRRGGMFPSTAAPAAPDTVVSATKPGPAAPATKANPTVPATKANPTVPATNANPTVPATKVEPAVPATKVEPGLFDGMSIFGSSSPSVPTSSPPVKVPGPGIGGYLKKRGKTNRGKSKRRMNRKSKSRKRR